MPSTCSQHSHVSAVWLPYSDTSLRTYHWAPPPDTPCSIGWNSPNPTSSSTHGPVHSWVNARWVWVWLPWSSIPLPPSRTQGGSLCIYLYSRGTLTWPSYSAQLLLYNIPLWGMSLRGRVWDYIFCGCLPCLLSKSKISSWMVLMTTFLSF